MDPFSGSSLEAFRQWNRESSFSLEVFFNIADALDVDPADLIHASVFPDRIIANKKAMTTAVMTAQEIAEELLNIIPKNNDM